MKPKKYVLLSGFILIMVGVGAGFYFWYQGQKIEIVRTTLIDIPDVNIVLAIIKDQKLDIKNKLRLEVSFTDAVEMERRIIARDSNAEITAFSPISLAEVNSKGENLQLFAPLFYNRFSLTVKKDSRFYALGDLKGAKIAIRPKQSAAYKALAVAMKIAGYDLDKDFQIMFGTIPQTMEFLQKGDADATLLTPLNTPKFLVSGQYREILDLEKTWTEKVGFPMPFTDFAAHKDWIEKNSRKAERFRKMILEALNFLNENPRVVREYGPILGLSKDEEFRLLERDLSRIFPTSWDAESRRFTIKKAIELGLAPDVPYQNFAVE